MFHSELDGWFPDQTGVPPDVNNANGRMWVCENLTHYLRTSPVGGVPITLLDGWEVCLVTFHEIPDVRFWIIRDAYGNTRSVRPSHTALLQDIEDFRQAGLHNAISVV